MEGIILKPGDKFLALPARMPDYEHHGVAVALSSESILDENSLLHSLLLI